MTDDSYQRQEGVMMGLFDKLFNYRDAGEKPSANTTGDFGEPVRSLFTSTGALSLKQNTEITDDQGRTAYRASSKVISLKDETDVTDAGGKSVAHIASKVFSLHERHIVDMADGTHFELSNELKHIVKDVTNIEGLGWQLRGNIIGLDFQLYDKNGGIIAVISQKAVSIKDKYCIDIYQPQYEAVAVTILVALQHMVRDRENGG